MVRKRSMIHGNIDRTHLSIYDITFGTSKIVCLGLTAVIGAVGTHFVARKFEKSEASFRSIHGEYNNLTIDSLNLQDDIFDTHSTLESMAAQIESINYSANIASITLLQEAMTCLSTVCTNSGNTTSMCRDQLRARIQELNAKYS